jgi:tetratricopeptide (TPR) repeat protein
VEHSAGSDVGTAMRTGILLTIMAVSGTLAAQDGTLALTADTRETAAGTKPLAASHTSTAALEATAAYNSALDRLAAGDARGALLELDQVLLTNPRDPYALLGRADAYTELGDLDRAHADLWNVLGIQQRGPVAERALLRLGRISLDRKDLRAAETLFERYVRIAPHDPRAWCHRGMVRSALRQDEQALEDLDQAIALDPELDLAHVNKAIILLRMGFRQEGCACLQQAHALGDLSTEEMLLIHCDR